MVRARSQHLRAKLVVTLVLAVLALLPPAWLTPWSGDVASIVALPVRPLEWAFARVRRALRPAPEVADGDARLRELTDDREHYRSLWFGERLRSAELEQRLEAVEEARRLDRTSARPVSAFVLALAGPGSGMLRIDAGVEAGITAGDPVVVRGDVLVGRVVGEPGERRSTVAPITDPSNGRLDALVEPGSRAGARADSTAAFVPVQLAPVTGGRFAGEMAAGSGVGVGDVVRLADRTWKRAAQGTRLGVIRSMKPLDQNPLRLRIEVEPEGDATRAGVVVVKCEDGP